MSELQYTTVDRVLSKFHRDLRGTDINESDVIEWIGEALDFMKTPGIQEESVAFIKVKDYHAELPLGFQMVLQMAKYNSDEKEPCEDCEEEVIVVEPEPEPDLSCPDCCGTKNLIDYFFNQNDTSYRPYFDMQWQYIPWTTSHYFKESFRPIRLSNHTLFNTLVCKEKKLYDNYYKGEEYTIVGTVEKKLRFSFREGFVALAYLKTATDKENGYPLVPDSISHITAITYYIKWKIAEWYQWSGREGSNLLAQDNERKWLKYKKQATNWTKMPKSIDDYQDLLEQSHYLIPNHKKYYGFFGNLSKEQQLNFNKDSDYGYKFN